LDPDRFNIPNIMNIGSIRVKPSILHIGVFGFFTILTLFYVVITGDVHTLTFIIPTLILLLLIPMGLNYMSQSQYAGLIPIYEAEAREVKIRDINIGLIGKPIRFEALVEEVRFKFLNRPHFIVADRTGSIPVKMFTTPRQDIRKGDVVEVLGQVIRRYIAAGDPVVNGIDIRKISDSPDKNSLKKKK